MPNREALLQALQLTLDGGYVNAADQPTYRNVFSGITSVFKPEGLIGKRTLPIANLGPRKVKLEISERLAASHTEEKAESGIAVRDPFAGA